MSGDLASISSEAELVAFLRSLRTAIDEGLKSLGHDPDAEVSGFVAQPLTIGLRDLSGDLLSAAGVFADVPDADVVIDLRSSAA